VENNTLNLEGKHRYELLIEMLDTTISKFESRIKANRGTIATAIRRKSKVNPEMAEKIKAQYPWVSLEWLVHGTGEMRENTDSNADTPATDISLKPHLQEGIKLINNVLSLENAENLDEDDIEAWEQYRRAILNLEKNEKRKQKAQENDPNKKG
jgi:hypothetical protein